MENPVGGYAEYLKPCDIQEATQYNKCLPKPKGVKK